jgi:di/tricarboxylate transporter
LTTPIAITLGVLAVAVLLLIWERLRVDLVALLVLVTLALAGQVSAAEALSGFSNPAVVTIWAVFILSAGLARTGVANKVGRVILRLGAGGEARLLIVIMAIAGGLSAVMNNIGVAAMLLPVIGHVARRTRRPLSRLLLPMVFGTTLGGLLTLIASPTNILVSDALQSVNLPGLAFFDFARLGLPLAVIGTLYIALVGRRSLPARDAARVFRHGGAEAGAFFGLKERFFTLRLPADSALAGRTLAESRLGAALKLNVISVTRDGRSWLAPDADYRLRGGDQLMVVGKTDWLDEFTQSQPFTLESSQDGDSNGDGMLNVRDLVSTQIKVLEAGIPSDSPLVGQTLADCNFRQKYQANVLALWRGNRPIRTNLQTLRLQAGDTLLVQAGTKQLSAMRTSGEFDVTGYDALGVYHIEERLMLMGVPEDSHLAGTSLAESQLADAFGLSVLGIIRKSGTTLMPKANSKLRAGDKLLVEGKLDNIEVLRALQQLEIAEAGEPDMDAIESEHIGLVEAVISPHSTMDGKTLRQVNFREKFGLSVLAIWRGGRAYRSNLRELSLRFGDSLLIYGHRDRIRLLTDEQDFLVLADEIEAAPRETKASLATLIMGGVVLSAGLGWLPIEIAAVTGASLMVLTDCISMEEAYRSIQWQGIFLIAGMLPLGLALQNSGAAQLLAQQVTNVVGPLGPLALLAGLLVLTVLATQIMPNPVVAVLMAPIALSTALDMGLAPQAMVILIAIGASLTFLSPVGHPANVLVMGPGGYRFGDYAKLGLPLTIVLMLATLVLLPIMWPLF